MSSFPQEVPIYGAPRGKAYAKLHPGPAEIQPLGEPRAGFQKIASNFVLETRTYVVGWVRESSLNLASAGGVLGGRATGAYDPGKPMIEVPAGSELRRGDQTVATVTAPVKLACEDDCNSPRPKVSLVCIAPLLLRVEPPS